MRVIPEPLDQFKNLPADMQITILPRLAGNRAEFALGIIGADLLISALSKRKRARDRDRTLLKMCRRYFRQFRVGAVIGDELPIEIELLLGAGRTQPFEEIKRLYAILYQPCSTHPDVHQQQWVRTKEETRSLPDRLSQKRGKTCSESDSNNRKSRIHPDFVIICRQMLPQHQGE